MIRLRSWQPLVWFWLTSAEECPPGPQTNDDLGLVQLLARRSNKSTDSTRQVPNDFDFGVTSFLQGQSTNYVGYQYSYKDLVTEPEFDRLDLPVYPCPPGGTCDYSWTAQFQEDMGNGNARFGYLETIQFVLSDGDEPGKLVINDNKGEYDCAAVFYAANPPEFIFLGTGELTIFPGVFDSAPAHLTIIPFAGFGDCFSGPADGQRYDPYRALAVWISKPADYMPTCTVEDGSSSCFDNDIIQFPTWQLVDSNFVVFKGSLVDYLLSTPNDELIIKITEGATLSDRPLNNLMFRAVVAGGDCQAFVDKGGSQDFNNPCLLKDLELVTLNHPKRLQVAGYGRIICDACGSGDNQKLQASSWSSYLEQQGSNPGFEFDAGQIADAAQYIVYSGMLVLSSSDSIDVSGIAAGFGPKRFQGATQLNSAYAAAVPSLDGQVDIDLNNAPVRVFDFKVVGNWIDGSDGPEIMGDFSTASYLYLHVNDDSVKVAARGVKFEEVTALQGNTGSVINLGSYGKNRGVEGSSVIGVYVHRVTQNTLQRFDRTPSYDGLGGLVSSRTCPQIPLTSQPVRAGLVDILVENLQVNGLGWIANADPLTDNTVQGPNSVSAVFSIGVNSDGTFCDSSSFTDVDVDSVFFKNWNIYTNPVHTSLIFSIANGGSSVTWNQDLSVYTGKVDNNGGPFVLQESISLWPFGTNDQFGYYVCGSISAVDISRCWTTDGEGTGANNVEYIQEGAGKILGIYFPDGTSPQSTAAYPDQTNPTTTTCPKKYHGAHSGRHARHARHARYARARHYARALARKRARAQAFAHKHNNKKQ